MAEFSDILVNYGYVGMLVAAFLAGSFFPFSSEAVMLALLVGGLQPVELVLCGSVGNILGSMFNYGVGRMGNLEWVERYLHVSREKFERTQQWMAGRGAWMGFFAFLPILGSAITIVLGFTRANLLITIVSVSVGKVLRYALLVGGAELVI